MKGKFSLIWRVVVAMVLVLSFSLVAAVPAAAINQDETPAYAKAGETDVNMLQFDVKNIGTEAESFIGVTVSYQGSSDVADVDTLYLLASDGSTIIASEPFSATPISMSFTEAIGAGGTKSYHLAVDIASTASDGNTIDVALESITGGDNVITIEGLPYDPDGVTTIDNVAPTYDSAITGGLELGDSAATTEVYLAFTEATSGLDEATVEASDFSVGDTAPASIKSVGNESVILTMASALATDATPTVELVGSVADKAGNSTSEGSYTATDGLKPTMDSAITTSTTTIDVTFSEDLDSTTLVTGDFTIANPDISVTGTEETSLGVVELTLAAELDTDKTPSVTYAEGTLADPAGNKVATTTVEAADGLKPVMISVDWAASDETEDTLTVAYSEAIALPGVKDDYSVIYDEDGNFDTTSDQRTVAVNGVTDATPDVIVVLNIADQSLEDDPGGKFKVTLDNPGNVKDINGGGVDPSGASATTDTVVDFVDNGPTFVEATATSDTNIDIVFDEAISIVGTPTWSSAVTAAGITATGGSASGATLSVTVNSLGDTAFTAANLKILANTVEDSAGNKNAEITENIDDGQAPTMDSASVTAIDTIEVTFSEDLSAATLDKTDFSIADNTVTNAGLSAKVVALTLETELAADGSEHPDVTYTQGTLADGSGNKVADSTILQADVTDGIGPVLESVSWTDVNGDKLVSAMDTLVFTFNEAMDESTITSSSVGTALPISDGKTYGLGALVDWSTDSTSVTVTLATSTTLLIGDTVDPANSVTDVAENEDATPAGVPIEDPTITVPTEVWVDVGYSPTGYNDGHDWEYDAFAEIQLGINAVAEGGTVNVLAGTYNAESFPIDVNVANLTIESVSGAGSTTIDSVSPGFVIKITAAGVTIGGTGKGFKIEGEGAGTNGLISIEDNDVTITENQFVGDYYLMVLTPGVSRVTVEDNTFLAYYKPAAEVAVLGVYVNNDVTGSTFDGNFFPLGDGSATQHVDSGIYLADGTTADQNITISNNTFEGIGLRVVGVDSKGCAAIELGGVGGVTIESNTITNSNDGIWFQGGALTGAVTILKNTITDNMWGIEIKKGVGTTAKKITANYNNLAGNTDYGLLNDAWETSIVDAENNWWGDETGPYNKSWSQDATGDEVSYGVDYRPWLLAAYAEPAAPVTTYTISLDAGYNLVSLPLIPEVPAIDTMTDSLTELEKIYRYDALAETPEPDWPVYNPPPTPFPSGSSLLTMDDDWGYWVKMEDAGTGGSFTFSGSELVAGPEDLPPSYDVVEGWNLIGFKSTTTSGIATYLGGVSETLDAIYGYQDGAFFIPTELEPGLGYWIAVTEPGTIYP